MSQSVTTISATEVCELTGLKFPRHQTFVALYCSGMGLEAASLAAGYKSPDHPRKLLKTPAVVEALKAVRIAMAKRAEYGMDRFITEIDEAAQFAIKTENATALVRARELKAKALGLLVDRIDARVAVGFSVALNIPGRLTNGG